MRALLEILRRTGEGILSRSRLLVWIAAVLLLIGLEWSRLTPVVSFTGITESPEGRVRAPADSKVTEIAVANGDFVRKGQIIAILENPALDLQIERLRQKVVSLSGELALKRSIHGEPNGPAAAPGLQHPLEIEIAGRRLELSLLEKQKKELLVRSSMDGRVGSVLVSAGEWVAGLEPLATVYSVRARYVRGFIPEGEGRPLDSLTFRIRSLTVPGRRSEGRLVNTGGRMVPLPEQLRPAVNSLLSGREVFISLEGDHEFVLGEKVAIRTVSTERPPGLLSGLTPWVFASP